MVRSAPPEVKIVLVGIPEGCGELGVHVHLAVRLFEQRLATLAQAAKLAGKSIEEILEVLKASGVDAVDYPPDEVAEELEALP